MNQTRSEAIGLSTEVMAPKHADHERRELTRLQPLEREEREQPSDVAAPGMSHAFKR